MTPTVSVILPVLNGAAHLAEAMASILAQDMDDLELIVVDEESEDATPRIIADFARRDRRVRPLNIPRDAASVSGARADNLGRAEARGRYIARMDCDDIALPCRLSATLRGLTERDLDVCGGQAAYCGARSEPVWFAGREAAIRHELVFRPAIAHTAQLVRAEVRAAAPLDETTSFDDYEWQTRTGLSLRLGNVPEDVLRIRMHPGQSTQVRRRRLLQDQLRLRFGYFFRLFPNAVTEDFRAVNRVAGHVLIETAEALDLAGRWMARLADLPDPRLKRRMGERWAAACALTTVPLADLADIQARYAGAIAAPTA
ncbi:MAG TPA: glycosyltransferase family A protein [Caulobacteraceae bacterium]|jgi:glycosyltransferase involved in cell wall biosynthesis|nr:glycosyltransferase family A protein [Caulobacteraceae bacterium]